MWRCANPSTIGPMSKKAKIGKIVLRCDNYACRYGLFRAAKEEVDQPSPMSTFHRSNNKDMLC